MFSIKRKKTAAILLLVCMFVLGFSSVASASVILQVDPYEPTAYAYNNYWVTWTATLSADPGSYYLLEVWKDGYNTSTWNNLNYIQQWSWDDPWWDYSPGWHSISFKVYKQAGYNSFQKASGLLAQRNNWVYREN